jgi:RND family efflux transporter MFP subunit
VQFTQAELDTLKTIVATQQTAVSGGIAAVDAARSTLVNGNASYASQLDAASSAITAAQSALAVAQAQQRSTAAPARSFELAQAQARVAQAQGDLQRNVATLEDYRLRAPADGTITRVDVRVGEQAVAGQPAVSLLGSVPLQIKVKVAEADIAKVAVGQTATITLDAFGDSRPFTGGVAAVDQAPTLVDGVVYYNVTVMFIGDATDVKIGMSADVDILTAAREQVLVVPARAVRGRATALYVQVPRATSDPEERTVTIGLRGEDGLVEVLSGLTEGEQVVTLNRPAS